MSAPDPTLHLFLRDAEAPSPRPKTGLSASLVYEAYYLGAGDARPVTLELIPGPTDDGLCGFWEIDRLLMPGVYGLQVPPNVRRLGYTYVRLCFPGTHPSYLVLHGVEYDPCDAYALGLGTWKESCHAQLSSGLSRSMPPVLRPFLEEVLHD